MSFSFSNPPASARINPYEGGDRAQAPERPGRPPVPVAATQLQSASQMPATVLPGHVQVDPLSNPDAEFELCGWLLRTRHEDLDAAERFLDRLRDNDMSHPHFRAIVQAARYLVSRNEVCGATAVLDHAALNNLDVGGAEHLAALISDPIGLNADHERIEQDVAIIIDCSTRRRIRAMLQDRLNDLGSRPVAEVVSALSDDTMRMQSDAEQQRTGPRHISEIMEEIVESWGDEDGPGNVYSTGFPDLDAKLNGGFRDGELVILGARPGMGKTAFSGGVSRNISLDTRHNRHVLFFSLEMSDTALGVRTLAAEAAVPSKLVRSGEILEHEECLHAIQAVLPRFASLTDDQDCANSRLWIDSTPGLSLAEIRSRSRQFARKYGSPIIVVDYIQIVGQTQRLNAGDAGDMQKSVGLVSQGLKSLARELNTPVLALAQLNRALEQRANKQPVVSDLRESGNIEQDADIIMFLYRDVVYNPDTPDPNEALVIIAKQREGEMGAVPMHFNNNLVRFEPRPQFANTNMDY